MFESLFNVIVGLMAVLSIGMFAFALRSFRRDVATPDRAYMDPLSWQTRALWPVILFISHYFGRFLSTEYIQKNKVQLERAGLSFSLAPEQFFAIKVISCILAFLFVRLVDAVGGFDISWIIYLIAGLLGYFIPNLKLHEQSKKRKQQIVRMLPTYLDFITMAVEAGLSLPAALVKATSSGPPGLLRHELERVNRDIRAGAGRIESLETMAQRLEIREVTQVVSALAQAEKTGSSIGNTLRIQAEQQRIERFQRAEKKAMEAPVKLIFPLVAFIFPTTFIVLGFPIVMRLIHGI